MVQVSVTVCDVCMSPGRPTRPYVITSPTATRELDLCEKHAAPLEELITEEPRRRGKRNAIERKMATIDEIEAMKRSNNKKTPPPAGSDPASGGALKSQNL